MKRLAIHARADARRRATCAAVHLKSDDPKSLVYQTLGREYGISPSTVRDIHRKHCLKEESME